MSNLTFSNEIRLSCQMCGKPDSAMYQDQLFSALCHECADFSKKMTAFMSAFHGHTKYRDKDQIIHKFVPRKDP